MKPELILALRFPLDKKPDLLFGECGKHKVRNLQVSDFGVTASASALGV
jgi:hypothetical protein